MDADSLYAQMVAQNISPEVARNVLAWIEAGEARRQPQEAWARIYREVLSPAHDFSLHHALYRFCYVSGDSMQTDGPAWLPTEEVIRRANVTASIQELGLTNYAQLQAWSVQQPHAYWQHVIDRLGIVLRKPHEQIVDAADRTRPRWLCGAQINIVESCFQADPEAIAVIESNGSDLKRWTYDELQRLSGRIANGLTAAGVRSGDAIAVVMPMSARAVAIYLGIIAAGASVVSIADSFAADEIAMRLRLARARMAFTQNTIAWGAKRVALYEKVIAADAPMTVVLSAQGDPPATLRAGDVMFESILSSDDRLRPVACEPADTINILFSSGTTGEPKAIPWDHTTPIKCAADAHFHQDLHPGDIACWPTSLGWMMGPWLIFASMLNRATMALYQQAPGDVGFGRFVQNAGVTMLGLVPSLVRAWRQSGCMRGLDWTSIRTFSSTGECSNPADMLYLMHLAGYRPVIEYCGGTEIGGGYVTGTVVQPCIPSTFTTPALGMNFVLLDDARQPAKQGEVFIDTISIGLSTRLLNRDHEATYFVDTPRNINGQPMRRHGDELEALPNGYYRVAGRSDDTMNLGGIKVGCAEIERVLNQLPGVQETAAVAVPPPGGGPSRLVLFVVPIDANASSAALMPAMQDAVRTRLNPLFRIDEIRLVPALPRTTSNKVIRRALRGLCLARAPVL